MKRRGKRTQVSKTSTIKDSGSDRQRAWFKSHCFRASDEDYVRSEDAFGEDSSDLEADGGEPINQQAALREELADYYGPNAKYNKPQR